MVEPPIESAHPRQFQAPDIDGADNDQRPEREAYAAAEDQHRKQRFVVGLTLA